MIGSAQWAKERFDALSLDEAMELFRAIMSGDRGPAYVRKRRKQRRAQ